MTDPTNVFAMDDIKFMTGYNVEPVVASEIAVIDAIEKYYPSGKAAAAAAASGGKPRRAEPTGSTLEMASRGLEELQASLDAAPTTSRSSRSCRRSAPRRSPSRARTRRSSGWSTSC